jgi:hypothetical protein
MSSGKNLEFIVMLLIDDKKECEILRGSFLEAFKKVFQWKVNILFEKKNFNKINGKKDY